MYRGSDGERYLTRAERAFIVELCIAIGLGLVLAAIVLLPAAVGCAQDAPADALTLPSVGETLPLEANERAPWAGMLVRDEDLFALQSQVFTLELQLRNARDLVAEALAGRDRLLAEAGRLCDERVELHTTLWRARASELTAALAEARSRQGAQWYEILGYTGLGLVVGALIALPIGFALGAQ